ncbi:MAG: hypothetical protein IPK60_18130 [Sandaracinaceae bacterium]|nr:hypothetical protein [Sandaracinaceae bacterium]
MIERNVSEATNLELSSDDSQLMKRVMLTMMSKASLGVLIGASGSSANTNATTINVKRVASGEVSLALDTMRTFYIDAEYGEGARVFAVGQRALRAPLPPPSRMRKSPGSTDDPREKESRRPTEEEVELAQPIAMTLITQSGASIVLATHRLLVNRAQVWFHAYRLEVPAMLHRRLYDQTAVALEGEVSGASFTWTPTLHAAADLLPQEWDKLRALELSRPGEPKQSGAVAAYAYRFRGAGLLGVIVTREYASTTSPLALELRVIRDGKCVASIADAFAHGELAIGDRRWLIFEMESELRSYAVKTRAKRGS